MKIGIDARFFGTPGKGLGRYTEKLVKCLEILDQENEYEVFLYGESFDSYQPANPKFKKIKVPYRWYGWSEQIFYPFFLNKRKLDLVHFPHFNVPLLYRKNFVVTIHDLILLHYPTQKASTHKIFWYRIKYRLYLWVIRSAIGRAQALFTVSRFTQTDVLNFYPKAEKKMHVTLEGVDQFCLWLPPKEKKAILEQIWDAVKRNKSRPYILYVGNSYPHKNLDIFLLLAKQEPGIDIVLVGKKDYFYSRLEAEISKNNIKNIYLLGAVTDSDLALLYRDAHLYVFPSLYEGFGLPPLEAMQYLVPVLVSNRGSLPEIVGSAAHITDPENTEEFLRSCQLLLTDEDERQRLSQKGIQHAANFSWLKMAEGTKAIYTEVIKGN